MSVPISEFGNISGLQFDDNKVHIILREESINRYVKAILLFSSISVLFILYCFFGSSFMPDWSLMIIISSIFFVPIILSAIYDMFLIQECSLDVTNRTFVSNKKIIGLHFNPLELHWPNPYVFKYTVEYDSYKKITALWLVVSSIGKNETRQLIRFRDQETFLKFQMKFNEHFYDNKILEWHD